MPTPSSDYPSSDEEIHREPCTVLVITGVSGSIGESLCSASALVLLARCGLGRVTGAIHQRMQAPEPFPRVWRRRM